MKAFGIPSDRRQLLLLIGDVVFILLAVIIAQLLMGSTAPLEVLQRNTGASLFFVSSTMTVLYVVDGYNPLRDYRKPYELLILTAALGAGLLVQLVAYAVFPHGWWGRTSAALTALTLCPLVPAWRGAFSWFDPEPFFPVSTIIIGANIAGERIAQVLRAHPSDHRLLGFVHVKEPRGRRHDDPPTTFGGDGQMSAPVIGEANELLKLYEEHAFEGVVVAVGSNLSASLTGALLTLKAQGVEVESSERVYTRLTGKVPIESISGAALVLGPNFSGTGRVAPAFTRVVDVAVSVVGLALTAPVLLVAAAAIKLESRGPVFYRQERVGHQEQPFTILKLRTMGQDAEAAGAQWSQGAGDPRVTRVGRFLRRTRIDEFPQFMNVLRGDMALVGPRPERAVFVDKLRQKIPYYGLRFCVKPGLTGWAQVKYRYGATEEDAAEKLRYELHAIQEMNPAMYLLILLKTLQTVLMRPGS